MDAVTMEEEGILLAMEGGSHTAGYGGGRASAGYGARTSLWLCGLTLAASRAATAAKRACSHARCRAVLSERSPRTSTGAPAASSVARAESFP